MMVLPGDLDGRGRTEPKQEDDQNEYDRREAHGLFAQR
jgi:hypothetical protein